MSQMNTTTFFDYPEDAASGAVGKLATISADDFAFLGNWGNRNWTKLFSHTQTYRFNAKETAIAQGDTDRAFFIVASGQFELLLPAGEITSGGLFSRKVEPNYEQLDIIGTGSIVGEQSFLDGKSHDVMVRALTDGELVRLSYDAFEIFSAREPELSRELLFELGRILSLRLRQMTALSAQ